MNLHGVLLRILGKESKPNKATSNVPGVLFLNDDMKRTKLHDIANETSKQNVGTVRNISLKNQCSNSKLIQPTDKDKIANIAASINVNKAYHLQHQFL